MVSLAVVETCGRWKGAGRLHKETNSGVNPIWLLEYSQMASYGRSTSRQPSGEDGESGSTLGRPTVKLRWPSPCCLQVTLVNDHHHQRGIIIDPNNKVLARLQRS